MKKEKELLALTNMELLCQGIEEIAHNHGLDYDVDYIENGEVCIFGGCNVPTLCDVRLLCNDVKITPDCIGSHDYGIDIWLSSEWLAECSNQQCSDCMLFWKRSKFHCQ